MLSKKEIELERIERKWVGYCESDAGIETAKWTLAQRCLNGTATDEEYNSLDTCYASYDGTFTYVGPRFGPLTITGPNALVAWNRVNGLS